MRFLLLLPVFYAVAYLVRRHDERRASRARDAYLARFRPPGVTCFGPMRK